MAEYNYAIYSGADDDDFETNFLLDRNLVSGKKQISMNSCRLQSIGLAIVDNMRGKYPVQRRDTFGGTAGEM